MTRETQIGTVNGAGQWGSRLRVNLPNGFKVDDRAFWIRNVHSVNPITHQSTGFSLRFTTTKWFTAGGNADDILEFQPAIIPPGFPYQTVDALPIANELIFWEGSPQHVTSLGWLRRLWDWWWGRFA